MKIKRILIIAFWLLLSSNLFLGDGYSLEVQEWEWTANIKSNPSGAQVFCTPDKNERIILGKTPITVKIYSQKITGNPGMQGKLTYTYYLPVRRNLKGFWCLFEVAECVNDFETPRTRNYCSKCSV